MDGNLRRTVTRLLLLDTALNLTKSFSNGYKELGDGLDEMFQNITVKGQQIRNVIREEQSNNREK